MEESINYSPKNLSNSGIADVDFSKVFPSISFPMNLTGSPVLTFWLWFSSLGIIITKILPASGELRSLFELNTISAMKSTSVVPFLPMAAPMLTAPLSRERILSPCSMISRFEV